MRQLRQCKRQLRQCRRQWESINQSINQSINNQSINQSINQPAKEKKHKKRLYILGSFSNWACGGFQKLLQNFSQRSKYLITAWREGYALSQAQCFSGIIIYVNRSSYSTLKKKCFRLTLFNQNVVIFNLQIKWNLCLDVRKTLFIPLEEFIIIWNGPYPGEKDSIGSSDNTF